MGRQVTHGRPRPAACALNSPEAEADLKTQRNFDMNPSKSDTCVAFAAVPSHSDHGRVLFKLRTFAEFASVLARSRRHPYTLPLSRSRIAQHLQRERTVGLPA